MHTFKHLYLKYKHAIPFLIYSIIYLIWFAYLEQTITADYDYHVIHMGIDDYIPFIEIFVIPYFLWFAYIAVVVLFFFFQNKKEYYQLCAFLATGMTLFLIISTLWPNGHHLRPSVMPRDNIFTQMISSLYHTDTATNICPSIHVYNSLAAHFAIIKSTECKHRKWVRIASLILASSIILSTIMIKQHSVFDVLTAFLLAGIMYFIIYIPQRKSKRCNP